MIFGVICLTFQFQTISFCGLVQFAFFDSESLQFRNIFVMNKTKFLIPIFLLSMLALQVNSLSLTSHKYMLDCLTKKATSIADATLTYTTIQEFDDQQLYQIQTEMLNVSDFIAFQGWKPYQTPIEFFTIVGGNGEKVLQELEFVQDVVKGQDAPEFGLSTQDLQLAFGSPSQAKHYRVPMPKILTTLMFQIPGFKKPMPNIGNWSIIMNLEDHLGIMSLDEKVSYILQEVNRNITFLNLTASEVSSALNISPQSIENSVKHYIFYGQPEGIVSSVSFNVYVRVFGSYQEVLAGPIINGQPGIIQVKKSVDQKC